MDFRLLRMFTAVAKRGSLVAAARDLHLTPSAVSHGLKALETDLDCRLLDRVGKKVYVNQAGEQLLTQIQRPLADLDAAAESIRRLGQWGQTRLRIAASASVCQYFLPSVIKKLKKSFERLSILIESADTPLIVEMLHANEVDLGVGIAPTELEGLEARRLFKDELLLTFAHSHPWAKARALTREDLAAEPFIFYQRSSVTWQLVESYFKSHKIVPRATMEIGSIEAIKQLVRVNLGVSVLAPWTAEHEVKYGSLRMRPFGGHPLRREWSVLSRSGRPLGLVEEAFFKCCKAAVATLPVTREDLPY